MNKKLLFILSLFVAFSINVELNAQTTLNAGDIVIIAINGDTDATYGRGFSFMPLVNLDAGTEIYFTDYGWSDVAGAFINSTAISDVFVKYTAPAGGVSAGTVIRNATNSTTNFAFYFAYGISVYDYVNLVGVTASDEVLAFQGSIASPTFLFAATYVSTAVVASGWATGVAATGGTNGVGSALPGTGNASVADLTDDVTALSFNQLATANDNCAYTGPTTAATMAEWRNRVSNYTNWTFNDVIPIPTPLNTGPFTVTDALPVELTSFSATIIQGNISLNWQTATEVNNYGFEVERAATSLGMTWEKIGFVQGHGNSNSPKEYSYADKPDGGSRFKYRLKQIDTDGKYEYSPEVDVSLDIPTEFSIKQNFPNPFNPTTKIEFSIPTDNNVQIKVFNVLGMEVATLLDEHRQAGTYSVEFSTIGGASNLSSGVYFYKIVSGKYSEIKKMIFLR
ncbi:MAG: T9SS type A sorting domain-containing protein [Ignavibacteriaceae bacterium]|jgi:hypothetical protein